MGASPWFDSWAPAQFVTQPQLGDTEAMNNQSQSQGLDTTLHYKVAGTVILALLLVFVLQGSGFRFVYAGSVGGGIGK